MKGFANKPDCGQRLAGSGYGLKAIILFFAFAILPGCSASVNRDDMRAAAGAPPSTEVDSVRIPYNPALPTFVVIVESFGDSASGTTAASRYELRDSSGHELASLVTGVHQIDRVSVAQGQSLRISGGNGITISSGRGSATVGNVIAAQLTTALAGVGNISVVDSCSLRRDQNGRYIVSMQPGEIGPILVRGTITEFGEEVDVKESSSGFSLGLLGVGMAVVGGITRTPGIMYPGIGVAAANPQYKSKTSTRKGMVGIDINLINHNNNRVIDGFRAAGTFQNSASVSGLSVFGMRGGDSDFAASALGQALRVAINDAVKKIHGGLISGA